MRVKEGVVGRRRQSCARSEFSQSRKLRWGDPKLGPVVLER